MPVLVFEGDARVLGNARARSANRGMRAAPFQGPWEQRHATPRYFVRMFGDLV